MNKITSTKVIELLLNGWQLGLSGGLNPEAWMQRKLGCGGEHHQVHMSAFISLRERGRIRRVEGDHRWERYELT